MTKLFACAAKARCSVTTPSLQRAGFVLLVFGLAGSALGAAACEDGRLGGVSLVTTASPFSSAATLSLSPVALVPLGGFGCSGFVFGTSFNVVVVSSGLDLTIDSLTVHMIDGTNLGGPSVTIPSPQLNTQFGTTIVRAGTSRVFPFNPVFACTARRPQFLAGTVLVVDRRGTLQSFGVKAEVQ
jgi:hypothetical protein